MKSFLKTAMLVTALAFSFGLGIGSYENANAGEGCCIIACEPPTYYSWVLGMPVYIPGIGDRCVKAPSGDCFDPNECGSET